MNLKMYYHELESYFSDKRWKGPLRNLLQLLIGFILGLFLAKVLNFYPLFFALHGAVIGSLLTSLWGFLLKKGISNPRIKSGIYWIQTVIYSVGWSILIQYKIDAFLTIFNWNVGLIILHYLLFLVFLFMFGQNKAEAIVFQNIQDAWNESQAWDIRTQVWVKFGITAGVTILFIAIYSYLNYGF